MFDDLKKIDLVCAGSKGSGPSGTYLSSLKEKHLPQTTASVQSSVASPFS